MLVLSRIRLIPELNAAIKYPSTPPWNAFLGLVEIHPEQPSNTRTAAPRMMAIRLNTRAAIHAESTGCFDGYNLHVDEAMIPSEVALTAW